MNTVVILQCLKCNVVMKASSPVLLSQSYTRSLLLSDTLPPGTHQHTDTRVRSFPVLLECHQCRRLMLQEKKILWATILPCQWRVCASYSRISSLLKTCSQTDIFVPVPPWRWLSTAGACAAGGTGASKDAGCDGLWAARKASPFL